ncbi:lipocalin family protein [Rhodoflexus sp.]
MAFCLLILASACSHRLAGTWNIQKYEVSSAGQSSVTLSNIGTMTFKNNGKGFKNLSYNILGTEKTDKGSFRWTATDTYVTIDSKGSDLGKTWLFMENKKNLQIWKATDGANQIQILELKRQ